MSSRAVGRRAIVLSAAAILLVASARAQEQAVYPGGESMQAWEGRSFHLRAPAELEPDRSYSLMLVVSGSGGESGAFQVLIEQGFIVCTPRPSKPGAWATSEAGELIDLVDHLQEALPIGEGRVHAYGTDDWPGFFPHVAFAKKAPFVSATFCGVEYRGGSPGKSQGRRLGVFVMGPGEKLAKALDGKVKDLELAPNVGGPGDAYYQYWLGVMEGRFVPGDDLSFAWLSPSDAPELAAAKADLAAGTTRAFVYFYSQDDRESADARALQHVAFFDDKVRSAGRELRAIKLDSAVHADTFTALGCTKTPSVVIVEPSFEARASLEGRIKASALAKALRAAAK